MKRYKLAPLCGVMLAALISCGCAKLKARDQLNKGVAAYRNAQFQAAIEHFKQAISLDPTLLNAKLYLATAYSQQYVSGGQSEENIKIAKQTIAAFEDVLQMDPNNTTALASIGQMYYNLQDFDKAKEYQRRRLQVEPNNPEPYYWVGVIDWGICFKNDGELRADLRLNIPNASGEFPPLPEKARAGLEEKNGALVDEALDALQKAIQMKPNDFDTMSYLNLMYRQKADLEKDPKARAADIKAANDWTQKALNVRKGQAGSSGG
jgi:tetratricopeptide (TPR) repeat protein